MYALLMAVTVSSCVLGNSVKNRFAKRDLKNQSDNLIFNLIGNALCILIMAAAGGAREVHSSTILLSVIFGIMNLLSGLTFTTALQLGPMSLSSLIILCGSMITSTAVNSIAFAEGMPSAIQFIGIILIIISMVLVSNAKVDKNITALWFVIVLVSGLCNGSLGVIQKLQSRSAFPGEQMQFLFWTFIFSTLFNLIWLMLSKKKNPVTVKVNRIFLISALIVGVTTAAQHIINLKLVSVLPSTVFFPICSGSRILLTGLVDMLVFRTRLSRRQLISFVIGFAAIMMLAGVFG